MELAGLSLPLNIGPGTSIATFRAIAIKYSVQSVIGMLYFMVFDGLETSQ